MDSNAVRCALCNSDDFKTVSQKTFCKGKETKKVTNVVCARCGLVYNNPMPSDQDLKEYYDGIYVEDHCHIQKDDFTAFIQKIETKEKKASENQIIDFVAPFVTPDSSVFDIGCSYGKILLQLKDKFSCRVAGIEPDDLCVRVANEHFGLASVKRMFFEDYIMDDPGEKFNFIVFRHVLEHLKNPNYIFNNLKKILNNNGFLYITIPNAYDFLESRKLEMALEFGHVFSYTPHTITMMLLKHGFKVVKWNYDYVNHLQIIATPIENEANAVSFEELADGQDVKKLIRNLKNQNTRYFLFRVKRKISKMTHLDLLSRKWKGTINSNKL
jgi:2-polyprenyl-3-methyl-5-hydroxy-6-metoxy-1,4-benzoquinol methylase